MISKDILEKLICFNDEEIDNLNNKKMIDLSIFLNDDSNIIDANKILGDNEQLAIRKHSRFMEYPLHRHNYLELMYVYSGQMTHHIEGNEIVIKEGDLLLLNQNIEHSIDYCGENDIIFNFIIKPDFLDFLSTMIDEDNEINKFIFNSLFSSDHNGEYLMFKVAAIDKIQRDVEEIINNLYSGKNPSLVTLKLLVGLLLTDLMYYPELTETYTQDSYDKMVVSSIYKYIEQNYQDATLVELSKQINQPDYKICKLVKKATNKTFKQLVQEVRLTQAANLLKTTNLPVASIIREVGYDNMTYFYKIFNRKYGLKPKDYRQNRALGNN